MCSACPPLHSVRISPDVRLAVETLLLIMGDAPVPARLLASFETLAKWLAPHELKVVIMSHLHRFEVDWAATARLALKRRRGERLPSTVRTVVLASQDQMVLSDRLATCGVCFRRWLACPSSTLMAV